MPVRRFARSPALVAYQLAASHPPQGKQRHTSQDKSGVSGVDPGPVGY